MNDFDAQPVRAALAAMARDFHARGWMAGTAGNLSARDPADTDSFWITASGRAKGRLGERDFLCVNVADGAVLERAAPADRPSAETSIHCAIYALFPDARACLHVHSVDACLAAAGAPHPATALNLPPLEMLKGLGIWEQEPRVGLPLFENPLDVPRIATAIRARFADMPPAVPALLIRDHGITVWGDSLQQAYNRLEVMEFILSYLARLPR